METGGVSEEMKLGERIVKNRKLILIVAAILLILLENPDSKSVHLEYGRWGEEYLFFIRNWDSTEIQRRPSPLYYLRRNPNALLFGQGKDK